MNELEPQFEVLLAAGVMGSFPEYLEVANNLSLDALAVPERLWRFLTNNSAHWTTVSSFWRQVGKSKLSIILASNPGLISTGSLYAMELEFLRTLNYFADPSGTRLDFGSIVNGKVEARKASKATLSPIQKFLHKFFPKSKVRERMQRSLKPDGNEPDLEEKVRQGLRFLFRGLSATVVSNHRFPRAFGNAILVCAVKRRGSTAGVNPPGNWFAPPGSNQSSGGGNETAGASGAEGR